MSAVASRVYNLLVSQGMADTRARVIADTVDAELAENRRAAEQYADEAVAESKESAAAQFASKEEVARVDKNSANRGEVANLGDKMDHLSETMNARFDKADARFDKADSKIADVRERVSSLENGSRTTNRLLIVAIVPIYVAVLKYLLGF